MAKNFYTGRQAELATGAQNLVNIVSLSPESYGVSPGQIASYAALTTSFAELLHRATEPATKTTVAVAEKNVVLKSLTSASVDLARIIAANPSVTNAQLLALNLNPRVSPQRQAQPVEPPSVSVISVVGRRVKLRICDALSASNRTKAVGAIGAQVYTFVGEDAAAESRDYQFQCMTTRTVAEIQFPNNVPSGATVWVSCRWVGTRGQASQGSTPISFTLQGGAVTPAAHGATLKGQHMNTAPVRLLEAA
jgi:hypothetical protein